MPPGGKPTIRLTARLGQVCACAHGLSKPKVAGAAMAAVNSLLRWVWVGFMQVS